MGQAIEAAAVLVSEIAQPRILKPTDHIFRVNYKVLQDERELEQLFSDAQAFAGGFDEDTAYAPVPSKGGLGVYGDLRTLRGTDLQSGDVVELVIMAEDGGARVRCMGLVTWVRVEPAPGRYGLGVRFLAADLRDLAAA